MTPRPRRLRRTLAGIALAAGIVATLPARAPATIGEQRARLPPPADCEDPVAGTWLAHVHYPHVGQWYIFRLAIAREAPGAPRLTGTIHAQFWNGGPTNSEPPQCAGAAYMRSVRENATGTYDGRELVFQATDWQAAEPTCPGSSGDYLLDRFSGTVDLAIDELQSVLNADSPAWQDVPTVFRRVACTDAPVETRMDVTPPPPPPRGASSGCSCLGG